MKGTPYTSLAQATESYLKDFFAAPYECSGAGQLQSRLLVGSGIYEGQTILDLGVTDAPPPNTVHLQLCNHREYVMSYRGNGADELAGLILPRTTLQLDVPLKGYAGDPFDVFGDMTPEALIWTINLTVLDMLPGSKAIDKEVKIASLKEVVNSTSLTLVTSALTSCASSIKAALQQLQSSAGIIGLLDCLFSLPSFRPDMTNLFYQVMVHAGLMKARESIPGVGFVLRVADLAEPGERFLVETFYFPPKRVAFGYRLYSAFPANFNPFVGTWKFYGDWITIQADGTAVYQGRTHVFCDTDPRPPCDGGDRGLAGLNTTIKFTRVQGNTAYGSIVAGTGDRDASGNVLPVGSAISVSVIAKGVLQGVAALAAD